MPIDVAVGQESIELLKTSMVKLVCWDHDCLSFVARPSSTFAELGVNK